MASRSAVFNAPARQCLERGLIDEFHVHLAPVMLGDGIRRVGEAASDAGHEEADQAPPVIRYTVFLVISSPS